MRLDLKIIKKLEYFALLVMEIKQKASIITIDINAPYRVSSKKQSSSSDWHNEELSRPKHLTSISAINTAEHEQAMLLPMKGVNRLRWIQGE